MDVSSIGAFDVVRSFRCHADTRCESRAQIQRPDATKCYRRRIRSDAASGSRTTALDKQRRSSLRPRGLTKGCFIKVGSF